MNAAPVLPALDTIEFLTAERRSIVDAAEAALVEAHVRHYDGAGEGEVRRRLDSLFDRLLDVLAALDLEPLLVHVRQIAAERFESGYDLSEVQVAFNALETAAWTRATAELPPHRLARTLGLVTTILGAGKDALAREYVSLATNTRAPSLDLRALFAGTAV